MEGFHKSVLLTEAVDALSVLPGERYIDCTLGDGGHSFEILRRGGKVLGIDVDPQSLEVAKERIGKKDNFIAVQGNFANLAGIAKSNDFCPVSGIIFDLGFSQRQIEDKKRGFSFESGTLDMRMNPQLGVKAEDVINNFDQRRLYEIFCKFGQERFSRRIADYIVRARVAGPVTTGKQLALLVEKAVGRRGRIHPATRVFQALRIFVNSELENLKEALPQAAELLKSKGRLAVISFHSLEDGIAKSFIRGREDFEFVFKKPIMATSVEVQRNPSSRSAKLRVAQKK